MRTKRIYIKIGIFLVLLYICWCFPILGDDWYALGQHYAIGDLFTVTKDSYYNLNGRILGNDLFYYLIDRKFLLSLVRSATIFLIAWIICLLSRIRSTRAFLIVLTLVFCTPKAIFAQTYPWGAGFLNYVPPIVLILIYLYFVRNIMSNGVVSQSSGFLVPLFVLGVAAQLFVEHMSTYNVLMSLSVVLWYYLVHKEFSKATISYALGSMVGTVIMFAAPALKDNSYRSMGTNLTEILRMARWEYGTVSRYTISTNYVIAILLSLEFLYIIHTRDCQRRQCVALPRILAIILAGTPFYYYTSNELLAYYFNVDQSVVALLIDLIVNFSYFSALLVVGLLYGKNTEQKIKTFFIICSILIMNGPLLFVAPIGPRNCYGSYIWLVWLFVTHIPQVLEKKEIEEYFAIPVTVSVVACFSLALVMFSKISKIEKVRENLIEQQMQQKMQIITIPDFPYSEYLWGASDFRMQAYYFYEEPGDITFQFVPYVQWI